MLPTTVRQFKRQCVEGDRALRDIDDVVRGCLAEDRQSLSVRFASLFAAFENSRQQNWHRASLRAPKARYNKFDDVSRPNEHYRVVHRLMHAARPPAASSRCRWSKRFKPRPKAVSEMRWLPAPNLKIVVTFANRRQHRAPSAATALRRTRCRGRFVSQLLAWCCLVQDHGVQRSSHRRRPVEPNGYHSQA